MKFAVLNDTRNYHCGSAAVMDVIDHEIASVGGEVIYTLPSEKTYGNVRVDPAPMMGADVILINGEGSMHHGFGVNILRAAFAYVATGKKIMLVNSVWDGQCLEAGGIIGQFDHVFARESISAHNMINDGAPGRKIEVFPDLCMQAKFNHEGWLVNLNNEIRCTNSFVNWGSSIPAKYDMIHIKNFKTWTSFVGSMKTAKAVFTGLHHGMWACIKAKTPFVVFKHNCCKIQGVLDYFDAPIKIVTNENDLEGAMTWALDNKGVYEELFNKAHNHQKWHLKDYL